MNEQEFGRRIRQHLSAGLPGLDPDMAHRLQSARQQALARQRMPAPLWSLAGVSHLISGSLLPRGRVLAAMLALLMVLVGVEYWQTVQRAAELEEVDSALLADDLPINAYLDRGFDAWLESDDSSY